MSVSVQFDALRTRELRELLEDEDKINQIIRSSDKFQGLQEAAEKMLVSNKETAKICLSDKPKFENSKLLLAVKYKELENLVIIIKAKQEQLAEKYSVHYAQWGLLNKVTDAEEECEMLFQRFAEGKMPLAGFLDSFLRSQKLQHNRMVLVKKLQEIVDFQSTQRLVEIRPDTEHLSKACLPVCGLTTAVVPVVPACCHPPLLLPCGAQIDTTHHLQHLPFNYPGVNRQGPKWSPRPVRLQPLKEQQRRHQQAPQ